MKIYLAGEFSYEKTLTREMRDDGIYIPYLLKSYEYLKDEDEPGKWIASCDDFLLDSGAFTYLTDHSKSIDFDAYLGRYINFINRYDVEKFFELDIDSVVGTGEVRQLRNRLERETGRDCIPVWHPCRGKEAFIRLAEEYDYIAFGGIYDEISPKWFKYFPWFIREAHKRGTRIHGLGFTPTKDLTRYPFDSVDSRSWLSGGLNGTVYRFNGTTLESHSRPDQQRKHYLKLNRHNLREWYKLIRHMEGKCGLEGYTGPRIDQGDPDPNPALESSIKADVGADTNEDHITQTQ